MNRQQRRQNQKLEQNRKKGNNWQNISLPKMIQAILATIYLCDMIYILLGALMHKEVTMMTVFIFAFLLGVNVIYNVIYGIVFLWRKKQK